MEERCLCTAEVRGSNPLISTREIKYLPVCTCGWGGDYSGRETPVPISNTAVKPSSSDDTVGAAPWENRTLPLHPPAQAGFFILRIFFHHGHLAYQPHYGNRSEKKKSSYNTRTKRKLFFDILQQKCVYYVLTLETLEKY